MIRWVLCVCVWMSQGYDPQSECDKNEKMRKCEEILSLLLISFLGVGWRKVSWSLSCFFSLFLISSLWALWQLFFFLWFQFSIVFQLVAVNEGEERKREKEEEKRITQNQRLLIFPLITINLLFFVLTLITVSSPFSFSFSFSLFFFSFSFSLWFLNSFSIIWVFDVFLFSLFSWPITHSPN